MAQVVFSVYLIMVVFHGTSRAATHWIVTEDGKLQTQDDAVFSLRRPYDLVSLLEQEGRAETLTHLKQDLIVQKHNIEASSSHGSPSGSLDAIVTGDFGSGTIVIDGDADMEQLVYSNNEDCIKAGKALPEFDLYFGSVQAVPSPAYLESPENTLLAIDELLNTEQELSGDHWLKPFNNQEEDYDAPICSEYTALDFSMHCYEHLEGMKERHNLEIEPELDIHLKISSLYYLDHFGDSVNVGLQENNTSWIFYTLASYYWRGKGKAYEAVECVRRALHYCPQRWKYIPLTSLGNILHRSHRSAEAATVMHNALDVEPANPLSLFTLGNIYTVLADYNKSLVFFDNVLKLSSNFNEARLRYHAVICHEKVEKVLRAQHESLQKTLEDLQGYQRQQELWLQHQQKLLSEQAPPGVLLEQRLQYREHKIREIIDSSINGEASKAPRSVGNGSGSNSGGPAAVTSESGNSSKKNPSQIQMQQQQRDKATTVSREQALHRHIPAASVSESCARNVKQDGRLVDKRSQAEARRDNFDDEEEEEDDEGTASCNMMPMLIPITLVPPS
ncbi:Tetratricopeptide repeat protein 17 [Halotydeus destructor]|nr:Tetratricopeptide repeat protein 17 [Halotydeus destructor]